MDNECADGETEGYGHVFPRVYLRLGVLKWVCNLKGLCMRSPVFGMGTILANFQAAGNLPVVRDKLKIFVTLGGRWLLAS